MGRSLKRSMALQAAKNADTPQGVIDALKKYGTAKQVSIAMAMQAELTRMSTEVILNLKKQEASNEFAKKIMAPQ